jgi:hypothetical protein
METVIKDDICTLQLHHIISAGFVEMWIDSRSHQGDDLDPLAANIAHQIANHARRRNNTDPTGSEIVGSSRRLCAPGEQGCRQHNPDSGVCLQSNHNSNFLKDNFVIPKSQNALYVTVSFVSRIKVALHLHGCRAGERGAGLHRCSSLFAVK